MTSPANHSIQRYKSLHLATTSPPLTLTAPMDKIAADIEKGKELKHVETQDKSAPKIESDVKIKKVDRGGFLQEVEKGKDLKHAETVDKSAPQLDPNVHVKKIDRGEFLQEVEKGKELKHVDK